MSKQKQEQGSSTALEDEEHQIELSPTCYAFLAKDGSYLQIVTKSGEECADLTAKEALVLLSWLGAYRAELVAATQQL